MKNDFERRWSAAYISNDIFLLEPQLLLRLLSYNIYNSHNICIRLHYDTKYNSIEFYNRNYLEYRYLNNAAQ